MQKKIIISLLYQLPTFKRAARQTGYGIGGIFKELKRTFTPVVKKGLLNLGKQTLQIGDQVLNDVSRGENVKVAIKRCAIERAKKMRKKSINRVSTKKTVSLKQTALKSRLTASQKERVSVDLL